jgi:hypothetical protein
MPYEIAIVNVQDYLYPIFVLFIIIISWFIVCSDSVLSFINYLEIDEAILELMPIQYNVQVDVVC